MARPLLGISPTTLCPEALCTKPGPRSSVPQMSSISARGQAPSTPSLNPQTWAQADPPAPPPAHRTRARGGGWGGKVGLPPLQVHPLKCTTNGTEPKESGCLIEKKKKRTGRAPTVVRCGVWLCPLPRLSKTIASTPTSPASAALPLLPGGSSHCQEGPRALPCPLQVPLRPGPSG